MAISGHQGPQRRFRQECFVRSVLEHQSAQAKEGRRGRSAARTEGSAHDSAGPWAARRAPPTTARGQSRRWLAPRVYAVGGTGVLPPTVISTRGVGGCCACNR